MFRLAFPVIFFFACALAVELPKNFKKCYRDDPNLDACLQKAVQAAIKDMVTGTKELKIAPIDPLRIKKLDISQGSGPVTVELNFTDVDIHGMSSVLVDSVSAKLDGDEKTLTLNLVASKPLIMLGQYTVDGKVLVLPIQGSGNATLDLLSVTATIKLIGSVVQRQGVDYLIFKKVDFVLNPQSMKLNFSNLFNGNKELGDNMNKFLNENWSQVYDELRHSFQNAFALTIADLTHRFFAQVPYDSLIPPSS
ncbi:protein takeout [Neodiprion lecontei]|uniref:Protein takeout n=1 Tax=Neodiprion lecontei TaxID=441921 RepID=A0A6J0BIR0_NEOLC|nr:protein takeout [Neodiprion lecontei]